MTKRLLVVVLALITLLIILYGIIWYIGVLNVRKQIYFTLNYTTPNHKLSSKFGYLQYKIHGLFKPTFILEFINPILQLSGEEQEKITFKAQSLNVKVHFLNNTLNFTLPDKTLNIQHPRQNLTCTGNSIILYSIPKSSNNTHFNKVNYTDSQVICTSSDNKYEIDNINGTLLISKLAAQNKSYDLNLNVQQAEKETATITAGLTTNIINSDISLELNKLEIQHLDSHLIAKGKGGVSFSYQALIQSDLEMYLTKPDTFLKKFEGSTHYESLDYIVKTYGKKLENDTIALFIKTSGRTIYINEKEISDFSNLHSLLPSLQNPDF